MHLLEPYFAIMISLIRLVFKTSRLPAVLASNVLFPKKYYSARLHAALLSPRCLASIASTVFIGLNWLSVMFSCRRLFLLGCCCADADHWVGYPGPGCCCCCCADPDHWVGGCCCADADHWVGGCCCAGHCAGCPGCCCCCCADPDHWVG